MDGSQPGQIDGLLQELGALKDPAALRRFLRLHSRLHDPAAVDRIYDEVVRLARADLRRADRLAQASIWLAEKLDDAYCRAQASRAAGHVLLMKAKYNEALKHYSEALAGFRSLGKELEVGRTLYGGSLQALIYLGRYDAAFEWALEARDIFERHGDRLRLARLDSNLGNILFRQDRFSEALQSYDRALRELNVQGAPEDIAITLRNKAVCHISLGEFERALETHYQARAHCEAHRMPLLMAEADYNIAYLHYQSGEYGRAIELYQETRKHCDKLGDPYHRALCDLDQSEMFLELNLDEEGAALAQRAAASFQELGMRYEQAKAVAFMAMAISHQGKIGRAMQLFNQSRKLFRLEQNRYWVALIDLYQAVVLYQNADFVRAQRLCRSAFRFFADSPLHSKAALCDLLFARLHLQAGRPGQAAPACEQALLRLGENGSPALKWQAYTVLGQVREAQQNLAQAQQAYVNAQELLENLRSHLGGEELKIAFFKDKQQVYESLVYLSLSERVPESSHEQAFAYIERAKSRSLADLIALRDLEMHPPSRGSTQEGVCSLREELNRIYRQIDRQEADPGAAGRVASLRQRARQQEDRLMKAHAQAQTAVCEFGALPSAGTVDLATIRNALDSTATLVEYYAARDRFYACVLRRDALEIVPLAAVETVKQQLRLFRFQISKFRLGQEYVQSFSEALLDAARTHLQDLYNGLVRPLRHLLDTPELVVVPHDFLHTLPFHALWDGAAFMVDRFSISYAPSASIYYRCCSQPIRSPNQSLVLGIPDRLAPHILEEVESVAAALPNARLLVGEQANEASLHELGPSSRFVHIATHGLFRGDKPMFSSLRLGDSRLSLFDLYSLQLSSELVTLSGCSTGLSAVAAGDEILGLVRGLLYAGTNAVLVTLWDVDDRSTSQFMKSFYARLCSSGRLEKAGALQQTVCEIKERYPHPYFWAPFVIVGKGGGQRRAEDQF
jgi:CHAT domain-containing protein